MPRGEKSKDTGKQRRQAEHIEEGYERRGVGKDEAERRAWATVNKTTGGGKKRGSGVGKRTNKAPARKGGRAARPLPPGPAGLGFGQESGANAGAQGVDKEVGVIRKAGASISPAV